MTTSLKDVSSAQMIKSLAELGCFEYEDTAYGCAYRKDGKVLYRMGGDWQRIHDFVENSRFGCPDCYSVFDPLISDHIRHLQGSEKHVGKHPAGFQPDPAVIGEAAGPGEDPVNIPELSKEEKIRLMEARLKDAVRREEYEEAAKLRDEIRALKEEKQNG